MPDQILIDQCAPTLAGLKTGNMFPVSIEPGQDICAELRSLNRLLREKGIRVVIFRKNDKRALLYLYRPDYLERDLGYPEARRILEEKGYCCSSPGKCLAQLIRHMTEDGGRSFPRVPARGCTELHAGYTTWGEMYRLLESIWK